jgi:hypothetical protein
MGLGDYASAGGKMSIAVRGYLSACRMFRGRRCIFDASLSADRYIGAVPSIYLWLSLAFCEGFQLKPSGNRCRRFAAFISCLSWLCPVRKTAYIDSHDLATKELL